MKPTNVQVLNNTVQLYYGQDVIKTLKTLPDNSVHMVATSPPYWGLRDYGTGDAQIGLEQTPDEYVAKLVEVFQEVARVLRPDGTLWINLGDTYVNSPRGNKAPGGGNLTNSNIGSDVETSRWQGSQVVDKSKNTSLKPKDLVGIPWRVAFALQDQGWYLRSDIIWAKGSCMPESVRDRPTKAHEYIFLFAHPDSKGRYFYDADAIREPSVYADSSGGVGYHNGRNKRSWWNINPKPYKGAHFAVWPPELVRIMIRAGTSEDGCCSRCGAQRVRLVHRPRPPRDGKVKPNSRDGGLTAEQGFERVGMSHFKTDQWTKANPPRTVGWTPTCDCNEPQTQPAIVLDPFSGSATTGMVATQEGRDFIGIDLNADYLSLAMNRVKELPPPIEDDDDDDVLDLNDIF